MTPFSEFDEKAGDPFTEFGAPSAAVQEESAPASAAAFGPDGEVENNTDVTKCPACGANMVYDSTRGKLYCEHCGTEADVESRSSEELSFERLLGAVGEWGEETHVFRCENCGAQEVLSGGEISKKCSFCGTTNIVRSDELPGIRPNAVVPFAIPKDEAVAKVKHWARKKWYAPRRFRKGAQPEDVNGVYMPAFSFDTYADATYQGVLGKYRYRNRRVNGKMVQERYLETFPIAGNYSTSFDDILIQASDRIEQKSINKLQPFETNESKQYRKEYLSGYTAGQYTKDGLACWEEAKGVIDANLRSLILAGYTYDTVVSLNVNFHCRNTTFKYLLLPIYVGHCTFKHKLYNFFVSGHNGKVTGKAPVSPLKVAILTLLGIALVVGIVFFVMYT